MSSRVPAPGSAAAGGLPVHTIAPPGPPPPDPANPNPFGNAGGPAPVQTTPTYYGNGVAGETAAVNTPSPFDTSYAPTGGAAVSEGTQPRLTGSTQINPPTTPFNWAGEIPGDMDTSGPGYGEVNWQQTGAQYQGLTAQQQIFNNMSPELASTQPGHQVMMDNIGQMGAAGQGQQYAGQALSAFSDRTGGANAASQVFGDWQNSAAPNMNAYYENETRKALERINQNAAARGVYGSSAALAEGSEAVTNLAADQAKAEAQYNLDRLGLGGELALGAENSQMGWSQQLGDFAFEAEKADFERDLGVTKTAKMMDDGRRDWLSLGLDAAEGADTSELAFLNGGNNAAQGAQASREGRIGLNVDTLQGFAGATYKAASSWFEQLNEDQIGLFMNSREAALAALSTALGYDEYERQQHETEMNQWFDLWTMGMKSKGGGGGGGGGGGMPSGGG